MPSAKRERECFELCMVMGEICLCSLIACTRGSVESVNKSGERGQPCLIPLCKMKAEAC